MKLSVMGSGGKLLIALGLSRKNLEKLQEGRPIYIPAEEAVKLGLPAAELVIFFEETEAVMREKLVELGVLPPGFTGTHYENAN